ncbi:hypothetical protein REJC140_01374 [Pseudorhizobium endolithicum]|uniref:DUF1127 domain-containing protein n=1 Tax=Pseudorhizobium endolithicum TaxID=1191678 RepID=A0ABM8PTY6_9HYPH|nr:hypothetical protein [Pseudorhizobium endolithicum]CAD6430464.1 hypothetical protein REQ54_03454 [Rhizobium sp. Q54]CAD7048389.1 hypothetical protein REJC140_01374 [Pseudorhizobium endolithicum]
MQVRLLMSIFGWVNRQGRRQAKSHGPERERTRRRDLDRYNDYILRDIGFHDGYYRPRSRRNPSEF